MAEMPPSQEPSNYYRPGFDWGNNPRRGPGIYFDHITTAVQIVQRRLDLFIPATLLTGIAYYLLQLPFTIAQQLIMFKDPMFFFDMSGGEFIAFFSMAFLGSIIPMMALYAMLGGVYQIAIKTIRGEHAEFNDLFAGFKHFLNLALIGLLTTVFVYIGLIFCILPGFYVAGVLLLAPLIQVRQNRGGWESLVRSYQSVNRFGLQAALLAFLLYLVLILGFACCFIGILFALPVALTTIALVYNDFFPDDVDVSTLTDDPQPA